MKVTVTTINDTIFTLEVPEDLKLKNFKAFCEIDSGYPRNEILFVYNGAPLANDKMSLKDYGITDGDVVVIQRHRLPHDDTSATTGHDEAAASVPTSLRPEDDPEVVRNMLLQDPRRLSLLKQHNPHLADALMSGSVERFASVFREQLDVLSAQRQRRDRLLKAGACNEEAQRYIAEEIRKRNIQTNMAAAMEYIPETFDSVIMLYIDCKVNGTPVKAFVDTGAQATVISADCAKRCNVMRLVDGRWSGLAKGIGAQKIMGRIHIAQIQIENDFFNTSLVVLEKQPMDVLLGLDMLKRHQCKINLATNMLQIGTTGTMTPFLTDNELPEHLRRPFEKF